MSHEERKEDDDSRQREKSCHQQERTYGYLVLGRVRLFYHRLLRHRFLRGTLLRNRSALSLFLRYRLCILRSLCRHLTVCLSCGLLTRSRSPFCLCVTAIRSRALYSLRRYRPVLTLSGNIPTLNGRVIPGRIISVYLI